MIRPKRFCVSADELPESLKARLVVDYPTMDCSIQDTAQASVSNTLSSIPCVQVANCTVR